MFPDPGMSVTILKYAKDIQNDVYTRRVDNKYNTIYFFYFSQVTNQ